MSVDDVRARIARLRAEAPWDPETWDAEVAKLHADVLESIAQQDCADPQGLAKAALEVTDVDYARWFA